jgi:hypothetical protein
MPPTNSRNIRIPDELWARVQEKAALHYTTASATVVRLLADWVREPDEAPAYPPATASVCYRAGCNHRLVNHREHPRWIETHPDAAAGSGCTTAGCTCSAAIANTSS